MRRSAHALKGGARRARPSASPLAHLAFAPGEHELAHLEIVMETVAQMQAQRASQTPSAAVSASVPADSISRLLDLLQLAAARGAYRLEEYERIGQVYSSVVICLPSSTTGTLRSPSQQQ